MSELKKLYERKYKDFVWEPFVPHPNAMSPSRLDDTFRLLQGMSGSMLEVGSGSGAFCITMAEQFDYVSGLELAEVRVKLARQVLNKNFPHLKEKVRFVVGSADEPLPFEDNSFDVVVACAVLEHLVDVFAAMDEFARVCKPGGCLVLTVPNVAYLKHVFGLFFGKLPLTGAPVRDIAYWREHGWDGAHLHYFTKTALRELLSNAGFEPESWTGDGKFAKLRRWSLNLVGNITVRARRRDG